jgi:trk system potassium uptake protein TrkA
VNTGTRVRETGTVTTERHVMTSTLSTGGEPREGVDDPTCYVLGSGPLGTALARRLRPSENTVCVVDGPDGPSEPDGIRGDPTDVRTLEAAGVGDASTVVVATPSDRRNLLVAQLVRTTFDVPRVVVLVNVPDRLELLEAAGHEPICATTVLSDALVDRV